MDRRFLPFLLLVVAIPALAKNWGEGHLAESEASAAPVAVDLPPRNAFWWGPTGFVPGLSCEYERVLDRQASLYLGTYGDVGLILGPFAIQLGGRYYAFRQALNGFFVDSHVSTFMGNDSTGRFLRLVRIPSEVRPDQDVGKRFGAGLSAGGTKRVGTNWSVSGALGADFENSYANKGLIANIARTPTDALAMVLTGRAMVGYAF